ncbi:type 4a pilus minor pilin PilX [Pseudomonas aeruginosa]|nr:type 4a pilus minor pilin PilX [Pseudomonas aeruginosa]
MNHPLSKQRGATLVITLAILVIVTLLAVSSMREVVLESRITGNVIEQTRLQNAAESGLREGERRFVNTLRPPEPGTGCTVDNIARPCLLNLAALNVKLEDAHQAPVGVLKNTANAWMDYRGSDVANATTAGTLYKVQWNNLPIPSGGQVNEAESPEYGNLMRGIGTFYYETNSVARNQTNSETVLQTVLARLYTN